jgi:hypothetical protein
MNDALYGVLSNSYPNDPAQVSYKRPKEIQPVQNNNGYWFGADDNRVPRYQERRAAIIGQVHWVCRL